MAPRPHMRDAVEIGTLDDFTTGPEPSEVWSYRPAVRCRFIKKSTSEIIDGERTHLTFIEIHLPADVEVNNNSSFKLTKRNRSTLAVPEFYAIDGDPWYTEDNKTIVCTCQNVPVGMRDAD